MEDKDEIILSKIKLGDIKAYEVLFKRFYKLLTIHAFYILDDEMEAEDVVQLLFSEIWERKLYNNIHSSVKSYLQMAVKNRCLKILQKRNTSRKHLEQYTYANIEAEEEYQYEEYENYGDLRKFLEDLPKQRKQAFQLVHIHEKKYKDAAEEMGISINSVKTHLKLAVKELQKKIKLK